MALQVVPTGASLGAEVRGLDPKRPCPGERRQALLDAWHAHQVLVVRGQPLSDAELVAFSATFGALQMSPRSDVSETYGTYHQVGPEITVISNIVEDGKAIGSLGAGAADWHPAISHLEPPPQASLLPPRELPPAGGDSWFADMCAAYETLDQAVRDEIEGRLAIHDYTYTSAGDLRQGFAPVDDITQAPGARHPIVRHHPVTGAKALFLGRRRNGYVIGMSVAESERLLDRLWAHARRPEFVWRHRWLVGDLVIWDNRSVMHRRDPFDPAARRLMHRTQIQGDKPVC